ncbi:CNH domain-containing protein [Trichoderma chlorosporum]
MSFRNDEGRRYGQVPPVQYPVAGQQPAEQPGMTRQASFNSGDDGTYYEGHGHNHYNPAITHRPATSAEDDLFMSTPSNYPPGRSPSGSGSALSGYPHQYQQEQPPPTPAHAAYNPQTFAPTSNFHRSQSTNIPMHQQTMSSRYSASSSGSNNAYGSPSPTNYAPQAYNPAAYASAAPQRHPTYHGYNNSHEQSYGAGAGQASPSFPPQSPGVPYPTQSPTRAASYHQTMPTSPSSFAAQSQSSVYASPGYGAGYGSNGGSPSPAAFSSNSQAPYPTTSHMPAYPVNDGGAYYNRSSRSDSQGSSLASPYMQPLGSPGITRHPTNAPLPNRPMADLPEEATPWDANGRPLPQPHHDYRDNEPYDQESIMQEIEAELGRGDGRSEPRPLPSPLPSNGQMTLAHHPSSRMASQPVYEDGNDSDDLEGAAGVLAMQQAELEERRFSGSTFIYNDAPTIAHPPQSNPLPPPPEEQDNSSDSDFGGFMDLGGLSGGYAGTLTYGNEIGNYTGSSFSGDSRPLPTPGHARPAQVDYGDTGGLQAPRPKRLSFDEGDERVSIHSHLSGTSSPTKDDYEDLFYHPGLSNRPLPSLPPAPGSDTSSMTSGQLTGRTAYHSYSRSSDSRSQQLDTPENFYPNSANYSHQPERSVSLAGYSHTPQVQAPARSRTDAAEERRKMARQQHTTPGAPITEYDAGMNPPVGGFDSITLPTGGRKKKFIPSKLTPSDFRRCPEPWALSGIEAWVREMAEGELDLKEKIVEEALTNMFTFKVPTMNVADAEALSTIVLAQMLRYGVLLPDEEWIKFGTGHISGVLWQLTGSGCFAPKLHEVETGGRCYSTHCMRTLRKVDLEGLIEKPADDWHVFYKLSKEDIESRSKKEVERQNILHEIVTGEESYIKQLDIFRTLYRDHLRITDIIKIEKRDKFLTAVFGKLDTVVRINKDHLLAQLKYRQQEQGPWIVGFSDIFREWIRKAKNDYIEYATQYPRAAYMIRKEAGRNLLFKKFLEDKQKDKASLKQDWTHFLITPLQRLQRYILLLETVERKMAGESEEMTILKRAIEEIRIVTLECDAKVAETNKRVEMMELDRTLILRPGFQALLNLDHLGRVLIIQGDLQRLSSSGIKWVDTHALLFDHYLILAKVVVSRDGREKKYDVSREPIPMPLLFLESMNDDPVIKQKGITAPIARTTAVGPAGVGSTTQLSSRPGLEHTATNSTTGSATALTPAPTNDVEGNILYPFKIKHLGHEVYTLYASSARDRTDWCSKIVEAKTTHAKGLFSQNAEPFRLRVLADAAFHYDISSPHARSAGVPIVKGTPLDRAIEELEGVLGSAQGVAPVCRAQVNCATAFSAFGKAVIAIGTDYGIYIADPSNPRGWTRTVQIARVTQIAVLEEFNVCVVIADKSLISYPLDVIAPVSEYAPPVSDNPRRAPQRLAKDVTYFATARMKDRTLLFHKRKEGLHTMFKVLEPILQKSSEKKSRLFGRGKGASGSTESFRDFDEFFFPTECFSLSLFQTYVAVSTAKGIEMLTLDKKQPISIPDLKAPAISNIANRIREQHPLGMFRLNENEFILTYEDCAVYVDKHGEVSRTLIMEYTGKQKKARGATMYGQYLILYNEDYVEVRNADNGRLRQIIAGRDVRLIDFGVRGPTGDNAAQASQAYGHNGGLSTAGDISKGTVKIAMSHPELPGRQIILEMLLNDGHAE